MSPPDAQQRPVRRLAQQLDLDGQLHDLAPQSERMRLFEPAPAQIAGQMFNDHDEESEQAMSNPALAALRHHVTGAVERGEAEPITEQAVAPKRPTIKQSRTYQDAGNLTRYRQWPHEIVPDYVEVIAD